MLIKVLYQFQRWLLFLQWWGLKIETIYNAIKSTPKTSLVSPINKRNVASQILISHIRRRRYFWCLPKQVTFLYWGNSSKYLRFNQKWLVFTTVLLHVKSKNHTTSILYQRIMRSPKFQPKVTFTIFKIQQTKHNTLAFKRMCKRAQCSFW